MASNNNYPPVDLIERRNQTNYKIQNELRVLEKRMNQHYLNTAAKQAGEKEREKCRRENIYPPFAQAMTEYKVREAAEKERIRLVAEERKKLIDRGELNIPSRNKYIPSLEERNKMLQWKKWDEQKQQKMIAIDQRAAQEMEKELGPLYKMSPSLLRNKR